MTACRNREPSGPSGWMCELGPVDQQQPATEMGSATASGGAGVDGVATREQGAGRGLAMRLSQSRRCVSPIQYQSERGGSSTQRPGRAVRRLPPRPRGGDPRRSDILSRAWARNRPTRAGRVRQLARGGWVPPRRRCTRRSPSGSVSTEPPGASIPHPCGLRPSRWRRGHTVAPTLDRGRSGVRSRMIFPSTTSTPHARWYRACAVVSPESLDAAGDLRAAVESIAENASDAAVAPLFWGGVAGVPGLIAYRTVNTLDSMVGYRNDRSRVGLGRLSTTSRISYRHGSPGCWSCARTRPRRRSPCVATRCSASERTRASSNRRWPGRSGFVSAVERSPLRSETWRPEVADLYSTTRLSAAGQIGALHIMSAYAIMYSTAVISAPVAFADGFWREHGRVFRDRNRSRRVGVVDDGVATQFRAQSFAACGAVGGGTRRRRGRGGRSLRIRGRRTECVDVVVAVFAVPRARRALPDLGVDEVSGPERAVIPNAGRYGP